MAENGTAVYCRGVVKTYTTGQAKVMALRGIDLEVRTGELLMLVGPSGCGKTTLISVVAGILDHDAGECLVFGVDMNSMSQRKKTAYRGSTIGFVFQAYNLLPTLSVLENVIVPLLINGLGKGASEKKALDVLEKVGLKDKIRALPSQLSGGQQQRVAIARALVHDPKLIVCDEPTSALDADTGRLVMEVLRGAALSTERALIIVTHDNRIFNFADRIARMDDGRITVIEPQVAH